jgi:putative redox protein
MSVVVTGRYLGNKKVELWHEPSGVTISTDAPKDNQGEGTRFSPTDLVGASLGSCMLTIISLVAERDGLDLTGMHVRVEKTMSANPRRISHLPVEIHMPKTLSPEVRGKLERAALGCPVHHSLHPDIDSPVSFFYDV